MIKSISFIVLTIINFSISMNLKFEGNLVTYCFLSQTNNMFLQQTLFLN